MSLKKIMNVDDHLNYGRDIIKEMVRQAGQYNTLLDIGAGEGIDLRTAKNINPHASYYAIELYPPNVTKLKNAGVNVLELNIERESLPFNDECVDIVIANQILEHVKDIFWIFHEVSRVLKKNGFLVIGVPNLASLHNRLCMLAGCQPTCIQSSSAHVRGYTKNDLQSFVNSCFPGGFSLRYYKGSNFYPFPPSMANILSKILPGLSVCIFILFEKKAEYKGEFLKFPIEKKLATNYFLGKSGKSWL